MKPSDELLADGARIVIRPMDVAIPYEKSFIVESTVKVRYPDRTWPNTGLSPKQREHRHPTEAFIDKQRTLVAEYARTGQEAGTSVVLGFVTCAHVGAAPEPIDNVVTMLYVKRDFRGYGLGAKLLGGVGVPGDVKVIKAEAWRPNECWRRWLAYHERCVVVTKRVPEVATAGETMEQAVIGLQAAMVARHKVRLSRGNRHGR